jgi:hypothetical protein
MSISITYGLGGYCADCDPTHSHPLNNIIQEVKIETVITDDKAVTLIENIVDTQVR